MSQSTNRNTVVHVGGLHWATSAASVQTTLLRRPGVESVGANAVNQTATVTYDPVTTSIAELSKWLRDYGFHCARTDVETAEATDPCLTRDLDARR